MVVNDILNAFEAEYPNLTVYKIYSVPKGYLVIASNVQGAEDLSDPNYFVSADYKEVKSFEMRNMDQMFKAFARGPIWSKQR